MVRCCKKRGTRETADGKEISSLPPPTSIPLFQVKEPESHDTRSPPSLDIATGIGTVIGLMTNRDLTTSPFTLYTLTFRSIFSCTSSFKVCSTVDHPCLLPNFKPRHGVISKNNTPVHERFSTSLCFSIKSANRYYR
jgi:hypothetical protein